ncbi:MAG: threonine ammonia-lyase [Saprospiraceae bacterium]
MKPITNIPTLEDIQRVHEAIKPYIHRTPVLSSKSINAIAGCEIYFKCENFQKVGAFKMRGASSAVLALSETERQKGIATHSSGNHAQAVALSAKLQSIPAYIVMPENAPIIKFNATKGYGATIFRSGNTITEREEKLNEVLTKTDATFLHPYNNYDIIAGQATASKELHEDIEDLEVILAPIGGGGLMSGTALYTHYTKPHVTILGAEPKNVDDAFRSFHSGKVEVNETINTIADGLRTNLGNYTLEVIRKHVEDIITVEEEEIINAMRLIWERMKIIVEPSSAVPFAAVLQQKERFQGKKIGIIITGGNVDVERLPF